MHPYNQGRITSVGRPGYRLPQGYIWRHATRAVATATNASLVFIRRALVCEGGSSHKGFVFAIKLNMQNDSYTMFS
eukprot:2094394-Amphidinium_carterae.2